MNLCIDQGNTQTKVAIFDKNQLIYNNSHRPLTKIDVDCLLSEYNINKCIISSVTHDDEIHAYLRQAIGQVVILDHNTKLPIENLYETPETLGKDRLAAVVGANYLRPNSNLLVIDAGTAITYDFINQHNQYVGGNIAPGLTMRCRALSHFTQKLPLVDINTNDSTEILGKNTISAIQKGAAQGIIFEIEGYVSELNKKNANIIVFLTGGDTNYFHNRLKNTTFAEIYLVLIGLNRILEYNA